MKNKTIEKRMMMGVCVMCGDPELYNGNRTCYRCTIIRRAKARERYKGMSEERKQQYREMSKRWAKAHPEKVEEYKRRLNEKRRAEREE
jgi:acetyl-CoA carboxylase beta subunit